MGGQIKESEVAKELHDDDESSHNNNYLSAFSWRRGELLRGQVMDDVV